VCASHGGKAPQVVAKAAQRRQEVATRRLLAAYDVGSRNDPATALVDLVSEVLAWKDLLSDRVAELQADEWRWPAGAGERLHALVALFERAMDRAGRLLVDLNRLGLAERAVRVEEQQVEMLAEAVRRTLADPRLSLSPEQQAEARPILARHLRAVGT
jgi:hypothetical protein